jgi:hypothetical protein
MSAPAEVSQYTHPDLPRYYTCAGISKLCAVLDQQTGSRVWEGDTWREATQEAARLNAQITPQKTVNVQIPLHLCAAVASALEIGADGLPTTTEYERVIKLAAEVREAAERDGAA